MRFQTLKMAIISPGQGLLRSKFADKVHLAPSNVPTEFGWSNNIDWDKSAKV